jgi:predicted NAD/FAD-dependent oxidoreductase
LLCVEKSVLSLLVLQLNLNQALKVSCVVFTPATLLVKVALALALKRNEREMGLGTLATGHVLDFVACNASSNDHTPDAEVWLGVTGVFLIILPE